MKRKDDKSKDVPVGPFNNPFGGLKEKLGTLPEGPTPTPVRKEKGPARAVVRLERKGHGGKEVTIVEHLELPKAELEVWLKDLKAALGCGGKLAEDPPGLVLQGDQRERMEALLLKKGVRRVVVS